MQLALEIREGILCVAVTGPYGFAEAMELKHRVAQIIEEEDVRLGLVDLRAATILHSTLDIYSTNTSLEGFIPRNTRFAFVYSPESLSKEMADFSENVLVNAGYDARVCTDYEEALQWLRKRSS